MKTIEEIAATIYQPINMTCNEFAIELCKRYTKQVLEEYTDRIVNTVQLKTEYINDVYDSNFEDTALPNEEIFLKTDGDGMPYAANKVTINKESITNQLLLMLKELDI